MREWDDEGLLDHERAGDGRSVDPLLLFVEDLEGLDARLLPEDREALLEASGVRH